MEEKRERSYCQEAPGSEKLCGQEPHEVLLPMNVYLVASAVLGSQLALSKDLPNKGSLGGAVVMCCSRDVGSIRKTWVWFPGHLVHTRHMCS